MHIYVSANAVVCPETAAVACLQGAGGLPSSAKESIGRVLQHMASAERNSMAKAQAEDMFTHLQLQ